MIAELFILVVLTKSCIIWSREREKKKPQYQNYSFIHDFKKEIKYGFHAKSSILTMNKPKKRGKRAWLLICFDRNFKFYALMRFILLGKFLDAQRTEFVMYFGVVFRYGFVVITSLFTKYWCCRWVLRLYASLVLKQLIAFYEQHYELWEHHKYLSMESQECKRI